MIRAPAVVTCLALATLAPGCRSAEVRPPAQSLAGTWRLEVADRLLPDGTRVPGRIRFAEGRSSFDDGVEIQFKDRTLNVTPKPEDFVLRAPPGVTVKEVGCASTS